MSARSLLAIGLAVAGASFAGCATTPPVDWTNYRLHPPRSILVLPPLNNGTDLRGTYGYLSTITRPLAEMGFYVFPVAMVDQFLKENGLPGPGEMHQAPLDKLASIFGTDAVMYITLDAYGQKYSFLSSAAVVRARATMVDAKTGLLLWEGQAAAQASSGGGNGGLLGAIVEAAINQAVNSSADTAHHVSRDANNMMLTGKPRYGGSQPIGFNGPALPFGPYRPEAQPPAEISAKR